LFEILFFLLRQQARYDSCLVCKKRWIARPFSKRDPEIGREIFECKCGTIYATQLREWAHFSNEEKRRYFLWNAEFLFVLIFGTVIILGAYFAVDTYTFEKTTEWVIVVASAICLMGSFFRALTVRRSLSRQPHEDPMFQPGSMPWEW
jgi:hypothetical protein